MTWDGENHVIVTLIVQAKENAKCMYGEGDPGGKDAHVK